MRRLWMVASVLVFCVGVGALALTLYLWFGAWPAQTRQLVDHYRSVARNTARAPEPLLSCTLVTTAAAQEFTPWHARMPLLLTPYECEQWLDNSRPVAPEDPLFRHELKMPLRLQPLSRAVSNARNKQLEVLQGTGEVIELRPGSGPV